MKTGYYKLNLDQYVELYASPGARGLAASIDPTGKSLKCRFDSCYIDGPRNKQFAAILGLAGLTVLTLGEASPLLIAAAAIPSIALGVGNIQSSCFKQPFNASSYIQSNQCSVETVVATTSSQLDHLECGVNILLTALDVLIPAGASMVALKQAHAYRAVGAFDAESRAALGAVVRSEEGGARVFRNAEGVETTIFPNGRREYLYPQGNIRVVEENGVRTTRYPDGQKVVEENGIKVTYDRRGAAISRQNADGSIDDLTPSLDIVVRAKRNAVDVDGPTKELIEESMEPLDMANLPAWSRLLARAMERRYNTTFVNDANSPGAGLSYTGKNKIGIDAPGPVPETGTVPHEITHNTTDRKIAEAYDPSRMLKPDGGGARVAQPLRPTLSGRAMEITANPGGARLQGLPSGYLSYTSDEIEARVKQAYYLRHLRRPNGQIVSDLKKFITAQEDQIQALRRADRDQWTTNLNASSELTVSSPSIDFSFTIPVPRELPPAQQLDYVEEVLAKRLEVIRAYRRSAEKLVYN